MHKDSVLMYFSTPECNVCRVLRPETENLLSSSFPRMLFVYVDVSREPELAARHSVFSVPTVICFFEGKEFFRKTRVFGIRELADAIARPYELMYRYARDKD
jgi:thioredoxin 1